MELVLVNKALGALAGFFGGLSLSFFFQPAALHKYGQFGAGAIIGAISVAASFTLGGIVCRAFDLDTNDVDTVLGVGFAIGLIGVGTIGFVGNFFTNRDGRDIIEVSNELRNLKKGKAPVKRTPTKRTSNARR